MPKKKKPKEPIIPPDPEPVQEIFIDGERIYFVADNKAFYISASQILESKAPHGSTIVEKAIRVAIETVFPHRTKFVQAPKYARYELPRDVYAKPSTPAKQVMLETRRRRNRQRKLAREVFNVPSEAETSSKKKEKKTDFS